jgi:glucose-1-phosphate cytidylyltransferase
MKVAILAGGLGTRFSEETAMLPKPMIQVGDMPILLHIMKLYSWYGFNDFVILGGYKCYAIKEYFLNYYLHKSDVTFNLRENSVKILNNNTEPWSITVLDTGLSTMTGGRIKRAQEYLDGETFMLTYGDGVSDININELLSFHRKHGKSLTMTAVQPEGRFGAIEMNQESGAVTRFIEKPQGDGGWINGGFFVCEPDVFNYICDGDPTVWERDPLEKMAADNKVLAYRHKGFWKPMDMLRDKMQLESLWESGRAPWKVWK